MEEEGKARGQLAQAGQLFAKGQYTGCRKILGEMKGAHASNELNLLLCEYKESPGKAPAVMKKLMDILITLNIKLYEERPKQQPGSRERTPRIAHELYYWNIAVLAQVVGHRQILELVVSQALHFTDALRTETSLMLVYQMLSVMVGAGRLASCIALVERQNRLLDRVRSTGKEAQTYRLINQLLFCRVLQKLGLIDGSRTMLAMRFGPNSKEEQPNQLAAIPLAVYRQLLTAEIEYHAANYPLAMRALAEIAPQLEALGKQKELVKNMLDHNLAIVLVNSQRAAAGQLLIRRSLTYFTNAKELAGSNQRSSYISKCRENLLLAALMTPTAPLAGSYEALRTCGGSNSYKLNYRKAEVCLKHYHEMLAVSPRVLPPRDIHDSYDTIYFHPNQPYFQQKNKNKNPSFTNGKASYRRYVLPTEEKRKEGGEGQAGRVEQALLLAQWYLKQALSFLEKEKSIIVNLEGEEKGLTEQVNEKLYSEYLDFKASILSLLCYTSLCRQEWSKAVRHAALYQQFERQYQLRSKSAIHQQIFYSVLTYKMEAQSQLGQSHKAYDLMQDIASVIDYTDSTQRLVRSTTSEEPGQNFVESATQYANFCFNIAVLHSRQNKIPQAYQAIQKLLQFLRISPSSPQAQLPLSVIDLLVHYNLRTDAEAKTDPEPARSDDPLPAHPQRHQVTPRAIDRASSITYHTHHHPHQSHIINTHHNRISTIFNGYYPPPVTHHCQCHLCNTFIQLNEKQCVLPRQDQWQVLTTVSKDVNHANPICLTSKYYQKYQILFLFIDRVSIKPSVEGRYFNILLELMEADLRPREGHFLFTSQSVTSGHPDKLCDYISDSVLDACLAKDPNAKVACESAVKNSICMVFGEITVNGDINFEQIARTAIKEIGYDSNEVGMDYKTATIIVAIDKQSPDIAQGVHLNKSEEEIGAGDQGLMIGYASDETESYMPLSHDLCGKLVRRLEQCRREKVVNWMRPDAKVQVTVEYKKEGHIITPARVHTILISQQHSPDITNEQLRADLVEHVIKQAVPEKWLVNTRYVLNPSNIFIIGGPNGDAGLTGRKIIADTYGGWGGHGGGAFSGKDPTKVDRSAAYAARWIAKNLVANGFCKRAMVQVAYSIGIARPLSIYVDSYNTVTEGYTDADLQRIVVDNFDLRPGMLIKNFDLKKPIYKNTASGGHFGRDEFAWEKIKNLDHEKKKV